MILLVVRKVGWQKSPWDSWAREFADESEFIEWWAAQPEDGYMKKVARPHDRVRVYQAARDGSLMVPWAPPMSSL